MPFSHKNCGDPRDFLRNLELLVVESIFWPEASESNLEKKTQPFVKFHLWSSHCGFVFPVFLVMCKPFLLKRPKILLLLARHKSCQHSALRIPQRSNKSWSSFVVLLTKRPSLILWTSRDSIGIPSADRIQQERWQEKTYRGSRFSGANPAVFWGHPFRSKEMSYKFPQAWGILF